MSELKGMLLKGNEVAKKLNISRSLAYRLMQSGVIATIRFGGTVRVQEEDLEKFIYEHRGENLIRSLK